MESDLAGEFRWRRKTLKKGFYLQEVDLTSTVQGCRYAAVKGARTLAYTVAPPALASAAITLTGGGLDLGQPIAKTLSVSAMDVLTVTDASNPEKLKAVITRASGALSGSFLHPALDPRKPAVKFKGVILQTPPGGTGPNRGYGLFLGAGYSGRVDFAPQ